MEGTTQEGPLREMVLELELVLVQGTILARVRVPVMALELARVQARGMGLARMQVRGLARVQVLGIGRRRVPILGRAQAAAGRRKSWGETGIVLSGR